MSECPEGYYYDTAFKMCLPLAVEPEQPTCAELWPWPLNAMCEFFENMYNHISQAALDATEVMAPWFDDLTRLIDLTAGDTIDSIVSTTQEIINTALGDIATWFGDVGTATETIINDALEDIGTWFNDVGATTQEIIDTALEDIGAWFEDVNTTTQEIINTTLEDINLGFSNVSDEIGDAVTDFWEATAGLASDILGGMGDALGEVIGQVWTAISPVVEPLATGILEGVKVAWQGIDTVLSPLVDVFIDIPAVLSGLRENIPLGLETLPTIEELTEAVDDTVTNFASAYVSTSVTAAAMDLLHPLKSLGLKAVLTDVMFSLNIPEILGPIIQSEIWAGIVSPLRLRLNQKYPYTIPDQRWLAPARAMNVLTETEYNEALSFGGLTEFWADKLALAEMRVPSFSEMRQMIWRGTIDPTLLELGLQRDKIMSQFIEPYKDLLNMIPGLSDQIRIAVREGYPDAEGFKEHFTKFQEWTAKIGFSEYWSQALWNAHWIIPSQSQADEMLYRGKISEEQHTALYILNDIDPDHIDSLRDIRYRLPGSIEARWLYKWDQINTEDMRDLLLAGGLAPEWADRVTEAISKNQWLSDINKLVVNTQADFKEGFITEDQLKANLDGLGFNEDRIEFLIADALSDAERERKKDIIDNYEDGYIKDLITEKELQDGLASVIVRPEVLENKLSELYIKKYKKPAPPSPTVEEEVLAEVQKYQRKTAIEAYRRYTIEKPELIAEFIASGLDPDIAEAQADYQEARRPAVKPSESEILTDKLEKELNKYEVKYAIEAYRQHAIDKMEMRNRLYLVFKDPELADLRADYEELRRPLPEVSQQEIDERKAIAELNKWKVKYAGKLFKQYAITKDELIELLMETAIPEDTAQVRADYEELKKPIPKPTEEEIEAKREQQRIIKTNETTYITEFRTGLINASELRQKLEALGYGADLALALTQLEIVRSVA